MLLYNSHAHSTAPAAAPAVIALPKMPDAPRLPGPEAAQPPVFSVIVVNWNGGEAVLACLAALARQTFRDFEVIVVDNGSTDGSAEAIAARYAECRLLRLATNTGFAHANNRGADMARGTWLALLNNDAFAEPDWLAQLEAATRRHGDFVGFASRQLQAHHPEMLDGAGDAYHTSGVPWRAGFGQPMGPPWDVAREIFVPCACAAAYRRAAFEAVGGFDASFFCYMEDVDLAFRMQLRGGRFMYEPAAVVHHVGSASTGKSSDFARYHGHRNMVWCFVKNMPGALLWKYLPLHLAMNMGSLVGFTLSGEGGPIWRAKWDALKGLPAVLAERRRVQRTRTAAPRDLEGRMAHGLRLLLKRSQGAG
jgi:GT2 family glycosyltransferase